jgi:hypothetical protein
VIISIHAIIAVRVCHLQPAKKINIDVFPYLGWYTPLSAAAHGNQQRKKAAARQLGHHYAAVLLHVNRGADDEVNSLAYVDHPGLEKKSGTAVQIQLTQT